MFSPSRLRFALTTTALLIAACGGQTSDNTVSDQFTGYQGGFAGTTAGSGGSSGDGGSAGDGGTAGDAGTAGSAPAPFCGDGACDASESCVICAEDCGTCPACSHSECVVGEPLVASCSPCVEAVCSYDATCCDLQWAQHCATAAQQLCVLDCGTCGDGTCAGDESPLTCPLDCGTCGDGACGDGEDCSSCPEDCGICCAHGPCEAGAKLSASCDDCTQLVCDTSPACCTESWTEACVKAATIACPNTCGEPQPPICGDGACNANEGCETCPADCGACPLCAHSPCDMGPSLTASCEPCVAKVCATNPACCGDGPGESWDNTCTELASHFCACESGEGGSGGAGGGPTDPDGSGGGGGIWSMSCNTCTGLLCGTARLSCSLDPQCKQCLFAFTPDCMDIPDYAALRECTCGNCNTPCYLECQPLPDDGEDPPCAHDVCTSGAPLAAQCDPCVQQVCELDPVCCSFNWDAVCTQHARDLCNSDCPMDPVFPVGGAAGSAGAAGNSGEGGSAGSGGSSGEGGTSAGEGGTSAGEGGTSGEGGSSGTGGASGSGGGSVAQCGVCALTSCFGDVLGCLGDAQCQSCVFNFEPSCLSNAVFMQTQSCACASCDESCGALCTTN